MSTKEIYKDVHKALVEDEKYQQVLNSMSEEEKAQTEKFAKDFMSYWQENAMNPLMDMIENDPEFKKSIYQKMSDLVPNKDGK